MAMKNTGANGNRSTLDEITSLPTNVHSIRLLNNLSGNEMSIDEEKGTRLAMPVVYKKNGRVQLNNTQLLNVQKS